MTLLVMQWFAPGDGDGDVAAPSRVCGVVGVSMRWQPLEGVVMALVVALPTVAA